MITQMDHWILSLAPDLTHVTSPEYTSSRISATDNAALGLAGLRLGRPERRRLRSRTNSFGRKNKKRTKGRGVSDETKGKQDCYFRS